MPQETTSERGDVPIPPADSKRRPCVVIIGGGFGGLNAARALKRASVDVFLIDRHNHHLFQPLLYQVATAGLSADDIASPIREVVRRQQNVQVMLGEVTSIDRESRVVRYEGGEVNYDYLVVAAGMQTNYFGNPQWEEQAPGLKTLRDALTCRRHILEVFEQAEREGEGSEGRGLLTFVVVGAGATGVEMAGAIREIAYQVMVKDFRRIDPTRARVLLLDAGPRVLTGYDEELSERARRDLEKMGVEVRLNAMVEAIDEEGVTVNGERILAKTVVWAAGVKGSPLAETLNVELDRMGRVSVRPDLRMPEDDRVFVIGDLARFENEDGEVLPGLAPVAVQQGKHVAENIKRAVEGKPLEAFSYWDRGKMATIGRARAIAEIGDWKFGGLLAWLAWLFVHLLFLIGFRNRAYVLMGWIFAYVGMRRSARLIVDPPKERAGALNFWQSPRADEVHAE
ncbi:NAD(P)/FAD-dependent oxidoreductase [Lujinxingia vulgaris]|uniref:NADH:ubiquinone reductase (non-electrogenic) n=1 Tax=Lujinxingia vulgaris TaxID=2600176 RepID=A0A5C6X8V4_9DELT|nr:NAD(P)/FAD-dependent oxidoreductase [Lujinxingia vulgaris]TXD38251.1 NAD(P)/FAD-dependent oxidoreductase [Lujinxingia vulgaris]